MHKEYKAPFPHNLRLPNRHHFLRPILVTMHTALTLTQCSLRLGQMAHLNKTLEGFLTRTFPLERLTP